MRVLRIEANPVARTASIYSPPFVDGELRKVAAIGGSHMVDEDSQGSHSPDVESATAATTAFLRAVRENKMEATDLPDATVFLAPHPCSGT
jgi:hypothetical protein